MTNALADFRDDPSWSTAERFLISLAALFSWSLAESYMATAPSAHVGAGLISFLVAFVLAVFLYTKLAELFAGRRYSYREWAVQLAPTLLPLHLTLPAAILMRPLGNSGIVLYEAIKLLILISLIKGLSKELRLMTGWPPWAASLLVLSPWILALVGVAMLFLLLVMVLLAGIVGIAVS